MRFKTLGNEPAQAIPGQLVDPRFKELAVEGFFPPQTAIRIAKRSSALALF
jgi:hypothetical protein